MIKLDNVQYVYKAEDTHLAGFKALEDINLEIGEGEFVSIIGRNGSGKSTLARLINAILIPTSGQVYINGMNTRDTGNLWEIRKTAGMIFQNPENQIVGTVVEEDVAFGPENLGLSTRELRLRVDEALKIVGLEEYKRHAPHLLSGGQKQKVAIAGILAMKPKCIVLDEATAMLDPAGRREVMKVLKNLNQNEGITVIHITHHMDEACLAKRVVIIDNGKIVSDGKPEEVFSNIEEVKKLGLDVPQITELLYELKKEGINLPLNIIDIDMAVKTIVNIL
jgi:energy-coupling factor transport system ATP-binding protein